MTMTNPRANDPDLLKWKHMHEIRRSSAASPVPNGKAKQAKKQAKHPLKRYE